MKIFLILFFAVTAVHAEEATKAQASTQAKKAQVTDAKFEDLLVQGQYHFSDESVVTVEQDKILDALLGVRTDFKDRIEQSATRF